jgi:hypothetical protein
MLMSSFLIWKWLHYYLSPCFFMAFAYFGIAAPGHAALAAVSVM